MLRETLADAMRHQLEMWNSLSELESQLTEITDLDVYIESEDIQTLSAVFCDPPDAEATDADLSQLVSDLYDVPLWFEGGPDDDQSNS